MKLAPLTAVLSMLALSLLTSCANPTFADIKVEARLGRALPELVQLLTW